MTFVVFMFILDKNEVLHAQTTSSSKSQWLQLKDALAKAPTVLLNTTYAIKKGPKNAIIQITEYIDFLCPHCKSKSIVISNFQKKYSKYVRVNYMMYPLDKVCIPSISTSIHKGACLIAKSAVCANNLKKFTKFHDYVFSKQSYYKGQFTINHLQEAMTSLKFPKKEFLACVNSSSSKYHIKQNVQTAKKLNIRGTPTIFINNKKINPGLVSPLNLGYLLQQKIKK